MRLIDADALMESVKKWLPEDPCGKEEKEFPFETDICVSMLMEIAEAQTIEPEPSQVAKDIARIVENGQDMRVIAQPEIIRCKDCKHWIPYDWMFSEVWQSKNIADYPEDEIGCNLCDVAMKANDFCSRGERRTE